MKNLFNIVKMLHTSPKQKCSKSLSAMHHWKQVVIFKSTL